MLETILKYCFNHGGLTLSHSHQSRKLSLHVRWESWVRKGFNGHWTKLTNIRLNPNSIFFFGYRHTHLLHLRQKRTVVFPNGIFDQDISTRHGCPNHKSSCFNTVLHNIVVCPVQALHTNDGQGLSSCSLDISSHFIQQES